MRGKGPSKEVIIARPQGGETSVAMRVHACARGRENNCVRVCKDRERGGAHAERKDNRYRGVGER